MLPHYPPDAMRHTMRRDPDHMAGAPLPGGRMWRHSTPHALADATRCHAGPRTRSALTALGTRMPGSVLHTSGATPTPEAVRYGSLVPSRGDETHLLAIRTH